MDHELHASLELPLPIDEAFAFFADAGNLERITPPDLRFAFVTRLPVEMGLGTILEYRLSLMGVPFGWLTRIAEWRPPHRFVDEQWRGPYARWVHAHTFRETDSGTLIEDEVRYRLPLAPLGDLAHPFVRRKLARIFDFRRRAVVTALTANGPSDATNGPRSTITAAEATGA
jgi:ligand-binding SRPBCC domain-containing protein